MITRVYSFETDTVWGLGCHPKDEVGVEKIYKIKGRDRQKPLILMSFSLDALLPYVKNFPKIGFKLAQECLPGGLTIVAEKSEFCPDAISVGQNTVGIRVPKHEGFWELCKKVEGGVLATTSANLSGQEPCKSALEVKKKLGNLVDEVGMDYGMAKNEASTVISVVGGVKILRQGAIDICKFL